MGRHDLDWDYLFHRLMAPVIVLFLATLAWGASTLLHGRSVDKLESARQTLAALEEERNDRNSRRGAQQAFADQYQRLRAAGIVAGDQRLAWVQTVRDARAALGLPYLRYSTGPAHPFEAPWLDPGTAAPVQVSMMDLQMGLLHEIDLFRLLERLRAAPGIVQLRSCALDRLAPGLAPSADKANVSASCQLAWMSIPPESPVADAAAPDVVPLAPAAATPPRFGSLLLSAEERRMLDSQRAVAGEAGASPLARDSAPVRSVMLNGIVRRSGGADVVWVNGMQAGKGAGRFAVQSGPDHGNAVTLEDLDDGAMARLRAGQVWNPRTGRVSNCLGCRTPVANPAPPTGAGSLPDVGMPDGPSSGPVASEDGNQGGDADVAPAGLPAAIAGKPSPVAPASRQ